MSISTHVLDTARGRPASGVGVELWHRSDGQWRRLAGGTTDGDGRLAPIGADGGSEARAAGTYRLVFDTGGYLEAAGGGFFPEVVVTFAVTDPDAHHHVPLLLSPFGYSTYRGS